MGILDELLGQPGVQATGGGIVYDPTTDYKETRFDQEGNAYQSSPDAPLIPGHTKQGAEPMFQTQNVEMPPVQSAHDYGANYYSGEPFTPQVTRPPEPKIDPMSLYNRQGRADYTPQNIVSDEVVMGKPPLGYYPNASERAEAEERWYQEQDKIEAAYQALLKAQGIEQKKLEAEDNRILDQAQQDDFNQRVQDRLQHTPDWLGQASGPISDTQREDLNRYTDTDYFGNPLDSDAFGETHYDTNLNRKLDSMNRLAFSGGEQTPVQPTQPSNTTDFFNDRARASKKYQDAVLNIGDTISEGASNLYEGAKDLGSNIDLGGVGESISNIWGDLTEPDTRTQSERWADTEKNIVQPMREAITEGASSAWDTTKDLFMRGDKVLADGQEALLNPLFRDWYNRLSREADKDVTEYKGDKAVGGLMEQNFGQDVAEITKGAVDALASPIETADAITSVVSGAIQHALPDDMAWNEESKQMASALGQIYADRYGSLEGFKKALAENPAEVLTEITGIGLLTKLGATKLASKLNDPVFLDKIDALSRQLPETQMSGGFGRSEMVMHHGTPNELVGGKFDHKYMGTGEGHQAKGWGTYLAQNKNVADAYRTTLSGNDKFDRLQIDGLPVDSRVNGDVSEKAFVALLKNKGDIDKTLKEFEEKAQTSKIKGIRDKNKDVKDWLENYSKDNTIEFDEKGFLYDVDVPDEYVNDFLDLDKPLSEQSKKVTEMLETDFPELNNLKNQFEEVESLLDAFRKKYIFKDSRAGWAENRSTGEFKKIPELRELYLRKEKLNEKMEGMFGNSLLLRQNTLETGNDLYEALEIKLGSDKKASQYLSSKGIKGARFLDQGSRNTNYTLTSPRETVNGDWVVKDNRKPFSKAKHFESKMDALNYLSGGKKMTANFVIYDEGIMTVIGKNGNPVGKQTNPSKADDGVRGQISKSQPLQRHDVGFGMTQMSNDDIALVGGMRSGSSKADETRLKYMIYDMEALKKGGDMSKANNHILGDVELFVDDSGKVRGLVELNIKDKKKGTGRKVVEALRASDFVEDDFKIHDIKKSAMPFWNKMGVEMTKDNDVLGREGVIKKNNSAVAIPTGGLLMQEESQSEEKLKDGILNNVKSWKPSDNLINFVKMMENAPLAVGNVGVTEYDDVGHQAKGYGTKSGLLAQDTEEEASKAMIKKLIEFNKDVDRLVKIKLNKDERNALVSLLYNIGDGNFAKSKALKALNKGDKKTFLKEAFDPKIGFVKSDGKVLKGLVNRRAREKQIFTKGNYGN